MDNFFKKIKFPNFLKDKFSKRKLIAVLAVIGVAMIFLSEIKIPQNKSEKIDSSAAKSVYAENKENSNSGSSFSQNSEYVIYDGENGDSPLLINEKMPGVAGVAVVCSGGDNVLVQEKIISCVCALFNIPSSRVSVSKINSKGGN